MGYDCDWFQVGRRSLQRPGVQLQATHLYPKKFITNHFPELQKIQWNSVSDMVYRELVTASLIQLVYLQMPHSANAVQ